MKMNKKDSLKARMHTCLTKNVNCHFSERRGVGLARETSQR
jgi:hypothetical protein